MDLAADLGCFSAADDQSFTFKASSSNGMKKERDKSGDGSKRPRDKKTGKSDSKQHSQGLTFSDVDMDVNSNYDGNIVCKKPRN